MYVYANYISAHPCLKVRSELPPFNEGEENKEHLPLKRWVVCNRSRLPCMEASIAQIPP
jgi:hypothetical protein